MGWGGGRGVEGDGNKIIKMGMASPKEWGDEYGIFCTPIYSHPSSAPVINISKGGLSYFKNVKLLFSLQKVCTAGLREALPGPGQDYRGKTW
jgi:hypothetical protein